MLVGLMVYVFGQKYLAKDCFSRNSDEPVAAEPLTLSEWKTIGGLITLAVINILFWAVYEQQGNTLQLFADQNTDWHVFGWEMPSTWFQSLNPAFIILLAPILDSLTSRRANKGKQYSSIGKMAFGAGLLGISF